MLVHFSLVAKSKEEFEGGKTFSIWPTFPLRTMIILKDMVTSGVLDLLIGYVDVCQPVLGPWGGGICGRKVMHLDVSHGAVVFQLESQEKLLQLFPSIGAV